MVGHKRSNSVSSGFGGLKINTGAGALGGPLLSCKGSTLHERKNSEFSKTIMMSPRDVINSARNEMNHTQIHTKGYVAPDMNVRDLVDVVMGKKDKTFGIPNYNPRNQSLNLLNPETHKVPKTKRTTFTQEIPKLTQIVPGPGKYPIAAMTSKDNWAGGQQKKFETEKKNSFVDQIIHAGKSPEKCAPGAPAYQNMSTWRYSKGKTKNGPVGKDARTTWIHEKEHTANWTPGLKFNSVALVSNCKSNACAGQVQAPERPQPEIPKQVASLR